MQGEKGTMGGLPVRIMELSSCPSILRLLLFSIFRGPGDVRFLHGFGRTIKHADIGA